MREEVGSYTAHEHLAKNGEQGWRLATSELGFKTEVFCITNVVKDFTVAPKFHCTPTKSKWNILPNSLLGMQCHRNIK